MLTTTENKYRQKIVIDPQDHIGAMILRDRIYDPVGIQYIEKILMQLSRRDTPTIAFDIGANIGNHALVMARYCQKVYLFEPQKSLLNMLQQTQQLNDLSNWQILNFGLGSEEKIIPLYKNLDGNNGASTFASNLKSTHFVEEEAQIVRGDQFVADENIEHIDFIKLDVEGFETEVIVGLANAIQRFQPIILMEWNNAITKQTFIARDLRNTVFRNYEIKSVIHTHHKSHWYNKSLQKTRRFLYKMLTQKRAMIGEFIEHFDYQHVILMPKARNIRLPAE